MPGRTAPGRAVGRRADHRTELPALILRIGRIGWVAKGVTYIVFGLLALALVFAISASTESVAPDATASAARSTSTDQLGALAAINERPLGSAGLTLIAVGLVIYSAWRWYTTFSPAVDADLLHRAGYGFSAVWYLGLAWGAGDIIIGGRDDEQDLAERLSAALLDNPVGAGAVALAGAIAIGAAVVFGRRAVSSGPVEGVDLDGWPDSIDDVVMAMGRVGWAGRSLLTGAAGAIAIAAAIDSDVRSARGFDGTIRSFADDPFGGVIVALVAVALVAYGAFCVVTAVRRTPGE